MQYACGSGAVMIVQSTGSQYFKRFIRTHLRLLRGIGRTDLFLHKYTYIEYYGLIAYVCASNLYARSAADFWLGPSFDVPRYLIWGGR